MSVFMGYLLKVLFIYIVIRSIISYYNYRRGLVLYRNVIEFLEKYSNDEIGWYVSIASALIKCQQYEYAHRYLAETKSKFSGFLTERPDLAEEIDINMEFCKHPIGKSGKLRNRNTNWLHYVMVYNFGNTHANNLSKKTMSRVKSWIKAGKP